MKVFLFLTLFLVTSVNLSAQSSDVTAVENERLFTDKDKDFLQLWYYDQVLKMQLNEEGRLDYLALLQYYTFKMTRLGLPKYENTDAEQKKKFDGLVEKLHVEMKDLLSTENYKIHRDSFTTIENLVYEKKNWKK